MGGIVDLKEMNLASNETILELIKALKERLKVAERLTIIAMSMMLIQTTLLVGGIFYFLNMFDLEVSTEVTQTVEGTGAVINNVSGESNTVTTTLGGAIDGERDPN